MSYPLIGGRLREGTSGVDRYDENPCSLSDAVLLP